MSMESSAENPSPVNSALNANFISDSNADFGPLNMDKHQIITGERSQSSPAQRTMNLSRQPENPAAIRK